MPNLYYCKECNLVAYANTIEEATEQVATNIRDRLADNWEIGEFGDRLVKTDIKVINMNTIRVTQSTDIVITSVISVQPVVLSGKAVDVEDLIRVLERRE